ncbi:MAG TPA: protein kinase [Kofleriaceae bacterium]|nr:protein kinase [Kofleriaceae bacterium]
MADAADDKKPDSAALEETLVATPGSGGDARPVPADLTALEIDQGDRYALVEVHAAGGLGRVMRARDRRLHRTVAVKELLQRSPAAEARFVREALITAQLEHPGIVPVHDAGRWPTGEPYYSMKLVSGRTLRDLIQSKKGLDERLALVPNAVAVAEAIAYAHSRDVIHRDIKPPNVLVGDFGETVVIDWGLAKDLSGRVAEPAVESIAVSSGSGDVATVAGNVLGTPAYMSPEQARGEELDARADVYSLGALLYEVLTGKPPHDGPSVQDVLEAAQKGAVVPVEQREPDAPPDLCAIVRKAMAVERADRYPTAMELAADLRRFQTGKLVTARQYSTRALVGRWMVRHRAMVAVVAAALIALAVVGVVAFRRVMIQRNRAETQMHIAERARDELTFRQAQVLLERDPTAALARLKTYPVSGERAGELGPMIDEAIAAGVARHVLPHPAWVTGVAFTSDGRLITADRKGNLMAWDPATGRGRHLLRHGGVDGLELSRDGSLAAIPQPDGSIELQPTSGQAPHRATGLSVPSRPLFSADGRRLVARSKSRIIVWDAATGDALLTLDDEPGKFANLSPDGSLLYVARPTGEIVEMRVTRDQAARTVARLDDPAVFLVVSPDGRQMLIGDTEAGIAAIDIQGGQVRHLGRHRIGGEGWLEFSHGLDRVVLTADDNSIVLYELATGVEQVLRGHTDPPYRVHFSRDDSRLLSCSDDGTVRIWDLVTGEAQVLRGHTDDVTRIAVSADEKWLASASLDGTARVWPLGGGIARALRGGVSDAAGAAFTHGGARLLVGNDEGEVESFDVATGRSNQFHLEESTEAGRPALGARLLIAADARGGATLYDAATGAVRRLPHEGGEPVTAVAISPDDRLAVTLLRGGRVLLWDVGRGDSRPIAAGRTPTWAGFLPARGRLLLAGDDLLEVWDVDGDRSVARAGGPAAHVRLSDQIEWSQDGRLIAVRDAVNKQVLLWDIETGAVQVTEGDEVGSTAVAPDGSRMAMCLQDRSIALEEIASRSRRILTGHSDLILDIAFSPDGRLLASGAFDRTVRLWRPGDQRSRVLRGHGSAVAAIAFSPDGKTLASVATDGTVRLWPITALPDDRPAAAPARLAAATTAVVDGEGRVLTPGD